MVKIYYRTIKNNKDGSFTINDVPALWRESVENLIAKDTKKDV